MATKVMRGNKRSDTVPERRLRSALHGLGLRFRKNLRLEASGRRVTPDVVFTRAAVAVFMDGCFWHSCPAHGSSPIGNADYWLPKLKRNVERDRVDDRVLARAGWRVVRVWEHDDLAKAAKWIEACVRKGHERSELSHRVPRATPRSSGAEVLHPPGIAPATVEKSNVAL